MVKPMLLIFMLGFILNPCEAGKEIKKTKKGKQKVGPALTPLPPTTVEKRSCNDWLTLDRDTLIATAQALGIITTGSTASIALRVFEHYNPPPVEDGGTYHEIQQQFDLNAQGSLARESADAAATLDTSSIWPLLCTSSGSLQAFNNLNATDHPSVPVVTTVVDAGVGSSLTYSNAATMVLLAVQVSLQVPPHVPAATLHTPDETTQQQSQSLPFGGLADVGGQFRLHQQQQQLQQQSAVPAIPAALLERIRRAASKDECQAKVDAVFYFHPLVYQWWRTNWRGLIKF